MEGKSSIGQRSSSEQKNGEQNVEEEESKSTSQSTSNDTSKQAEIDMITQFRQLVSLDIAGIARRLRSHVLGVITVDSTLKVLNLSWILHSFVYSIYFYSKSRSCSFTGIPDSVVRRNAKGKVETITKSVARKEQISSGCI